MLLQSPYEVKSNHSLSSFKFFKKIEQHVLVKKYSTTKVFLDIFPHESTALNLPLLPLHLLYT